MTGLRIAVSVRPYVHALRVVQYIPVVYIKMLNLFKYENQK
jgi:hypothetical protein